MTYPKSILSAFALAIAMGCGSTDSGGGGSCPALSGTYAVSGTCPVSSCTLQMSGCALSMQCSDGNHYSGSVQGSTLSFSTTGSTCSGTIGDLNPGSSPEIKGTCSSQAGPCDFKAECSSGDCTTAGNAVGAGGSFGGASTSCTTDANCPSGQGCKTEANDGYCAPLCMTASTCPMQSQCTGSTDAPKQECKEVGAHTGANGVCDLFNGAYGPKTCK